MPTAMKRGAVLTAPVGSWNEGDEYGTFGASAVPVSFRAGSKHTWLRRRHVHRTLAALIFIITIGGFAFLHNRVSEEGRGLDRVSNSVEMPVTPSSGPSAAVGEAMDAAQRRDNAAIASMDTLNPLERSFIAGMDRRQLREYLHAYAGSPHRAGTKQDYLTAVYTAKAWESFGFEVEIKEYYTLLSTPLHQRVAIVQPGVNARVLDLEEDVVEGDACTSDPDAVPPFLAYSGSGNISTSVVYVNYGTPDDFAWLIAQGVKLRGKIALIRYGHNFRGLKVMVAEQHQMAGVLIYSDPGNDGAELGPTYPEGPWRPGGSFQRGSTQYLSLYGGDPLTPGYASTLDAPRLSVEEATSIPHIPATVLSYNEARHILASLGGRKAPSSWQGGLVLDRGYRVGDDEGTVVNLDIQVDNSVAPIWNVMGVLPGTEEPDEKVILGNHRDAWVCGAVDPSSGSAALMEIARNLGALVETGWQPRRTIVLASWDGEEYGLLGSTEYAEENAVELKQHAVAYINVDNIKGVLASAAATPVIADFLQNAAASIPANNYASEPASLSTRETRTLHEQWQEQTLALKVGDPNLVKNRFGKGGLIKPLGSGSDFTSFYQHLGIVSADLSSYMELNSKNGGAYGVYHSTMDSLAYMEKFGDPDYHTHVTTARWWGLVALRLAETTLLPFDYSAYSEVMHDQLNKYEEKARDGTMDIDFKPLRDAINNYRANAELLQARLSTFAASDTNNSIAIAEWNRKLMRLERLFLTETGLPHRPWYKHILFGPGFYEGYAATSFPGIADAFAFHDSSAAIQEHVDELVLVINNAANALLG